MSKKEVNKTLRSCLNGRDIVLAFDETNNGFHLKCNNPHHNNSMIVTGYLGDLELLNSQYSGLLYEHKGRLFNGKSDIRDALRRAGVYLTLNPNFLYTSIPKESFAYTPDVILRARAIAVLALEFMLRYKLDANKVQIISDQIDGKEQSKRIKEVIDLYMQKAGLEIPTTFVQGAEHIYSTTRKADRVSYYLAAIHLLGNNPKWPHRSRRVSIDDLETLTLRLLENN